MIIVALTMSFLILMLARDDEDNYVVDGNYDVSNDYPTFPGDHHNHRHHDHQQLSLSQLIIDIMIKSHFPS